MARPPDRVDVYRVAGIRVQFAYHYRRRDVVVSPDDGALAAATPYAVLKLWTLVANWAVRFSQANHGWTVNGADPVETLGD